ncbi:cell division topological specificity factor MinE [Methylocystis echinoides]|uniref:Cell division topological specificity factor n=1 Tax=Methylocystis echinoides TaxID=29468 RepID=A0A9W6GPZ9_9HYPH|nr:cell division topological specificity factor MinE [Methylocystis echinoides]GLI91019.1 cell division topological specificity factor [Methylocystis echinoides]
MKLFGFFNRGNSAPVARERLQILLAHERRSTCNSDLLALLHREVLEAISKHVAIDAEQVAVKLHRRESVSMLEIDIELDPEAMPAQMGGRAA